MSFGRTAYRFGKPFWDYDPCEECDAEECEICDPCEDCNAIECEKCKYNNEVEE